MLEADVVVYHNRIVERDFASRGIVDRSVEEIGEELDITCRTHYAFEDHFKQHLRHWRVIDDKAA